MSYCRFADDSDVYAYACDGGVQFWVAGRANKSLDRLCNTYNEAYQYAKLLHDKHGLDVPSYAIEALKEDAIDEAERINGPNSAVAELLAENAKLRELVLTLAFCTNDEADCDQCPMNGAELHRVTQIAFCGGMADRLRDIGIEVEE